MRTLQAILFVCAVLLFTNSANAVPFEDLKSRAAVIIITGPESDPLYGTQLQMLKADSKTLIGRGVVTLHFQDKSLYTINELSSFKYNPQNLKREKSTVAKYYEEYLKTDDDVFSIVLMGRDGRVYYVWTDVVPPKDLYYMIDNPPPEQPVLTPSPKK